MTDRASERRRRILVAALECFDRQGVDGTTIADIRERSGASTGSIYHHFGSKEGIATALLVEGLERNARLLEQRLDGAEGAREGVRTVVRSTIEWIAEHPDWARFIYDVSGGRVSPENREALRAATDSHQRVIDDYFGRYFEAGPLRPVPRECFASLVVGPVHDYARRWLSGQVDGALRDRVDLFADAAWNALTRGGAP